MELLLAITATLALSLLSLAVLLAPQFIHPRDPEADAN